MLRRVIAAIVMAVVMVGLSPISTQGVADIYRDANDCYTGESHEDALACSQGVVWAIGIATSAACGQLNASAGFFTMGFTWIVGAAYCGAIGTM